MPLPPPEPLFEHLAALRDAEDPCDPRHEARWRAIDRWLAQAFGGADGGDARQETLIALTRSVSRMQAEGPLAAAKWVATIHRHKKVDALRARKNDPVRAALETEPRAPDAPPLLERLEADETPTLTPAMLEALVTRILDHVHRALDDEVKSAAKRQLRRTQAQATLLRLVAGWDADAIVAALDYGEPVSKERLYKWVERGRAAVHAGLDRWAESADEGDATVIEVLREILDDRRADAGKPRPDRRKRPPEPR